MQSLAIVVTLPWHAQRKTSVYVRTQAVVDELPRHTAETQTAKSHMLCCHLVLLEHICMPQHSHSTTQSHVAANIDGDTVDTHLH